MLVEIKHEMLNHKNLLKTSL